MIWLYVSVLRSDSVEVARGTSQRNKHQRPYPQSNRNLRPLFLMAPPTPANSRRSTRIKSTASQVTCAMRSATGGFGTATSATTLSSKPWGCSTPPKSSTNRRRAWPTFQSQCLTVLKLVQGSGLPLEMFNISAYAYDPVTRNTDRELLFAIWNFPEEKGIHALDLQSMEVAKIFTLCSKPPKIDSAVK